MIGQTLSLAKHIKELSRNKKSSSRPWNFKLHNLRKDILPTQSTRDSVRERQSLSEDLKYQGKKGPWGGSSELPCWMSPEAGARLRTVDLGWSCVEPYMLSNDRQTSFHTEGKQRGTGYSEYKNHCCQILQREEEVWGRKWGGQELKVIWWAHNDPCGYWWWPQRGAALPCRRR